MKKSLILLITAVFCCSIFAQETNVSASKINEQQQKLEKLKGTYRIESSQRFYTLPSNLADIIIENRAAEKMVIKQLSPETSLIIYPYSAISVSTKYYDNKGE